MEETTAVQEPSAPAQGKTRLTKEQRSAIAKDAAKRRWSKANRKKRSAKATTKAAKAPAKAAKPVRKKHSGPREFVSALRFAERELSQAVKEQADAAARYAAASVKIPHLHRIVMALQSGTNQASPMSFPASYMPPSPTLDQIMSDQPLSPLAYAATPPIPPILHPANVAAAPANRAQGGAVSGPLEEEEDENKFLKEPNSAGGGQWH